MTLLQVAITLNISDKKVFSRASDKLLAYCKEKSIEIKKVPQVENGYTLNVWDYPEKLQELIKRNLIAAQLQIEAEEAEKQLNKELKAKKLPKKKRARIYKKVI